MKRIIPIILCLTIISLSFVACSSKQEEKPTKTEEVVTSANEITTDDAKVAESDAINLIKSYSAKELGLTADEMKECSFMVASSGVKIENSYYVKVIATVKNEQKGEDGKTTFTFDNKGEYYIRYDAKQILKKNMKSDKDEYDEMKVKSVPTTSNTTTTVKELKE